MGFAAAEISLDRQAIVFIGSSSQTKCDAAVSLLKKSYPKGEVYGKTVNLTDDSSIKEYFGWVNAIGNPGVDHCIYTAGDALQLAPLDEVNVDTSKTAFDVRVFGVLRVVKVVKSLFNKGGSLTLTTGTVAYKPSKGWAVGSAMGGATESLTRGLAVDLAPIRVNGIAPGVVDTPLWAGFSPETKVEWFKKAASTLLTGTVGQPEDVAHGYLYLMSSAFATGTVIVIDGGFLIV